MIPQNIVIDISQLSYPEQIEAATNLKEGCLDNANFTFAGTTYSDFSTRVGDCITKHAKFQRTGDYQDGINSRDALDLVISSYRKVAEQVNFQSAHDAGKLRSSGGILTSEGGTLGVLPQAIIDGTSSKIPAEIVIEVRTLEQALGTQVWWRDVTINGPWEHEFFAQKHLIHLTLLVSGHDYELMVAHKGTVRQVIQSEVAHAHCS